MGIRKALVIGINYVSSPSARLRGCHNDALRARDYLIEKRGYAKADVKVALDRTGEGQGTTKGGIVEAILRLANATYREEVEEVYIHYSGHGAQMEDAPEGFERRIEEGGMDEALVPSDFRTHGLIRDDHINSLLQEFHPRTRVRCVFDCCHSGTMADLPWKLSVGDAGFREVRSGTATPGKNVVCISGCRDDQVSMDAHDVNGRGKFSGAMTSCMMKVIEGRGGEMTLRTLFTDLHDTLRTHGFRQKPVLTASSAVDLDTRVF